MIVNSGKTTIKNFFGQQVGTIADTLAFGTGTNIEALTDTALQTEVYRASVTSVSPDLDNNRIVFKATIPAGMVASFTEVGLFNGTTLVARKIEGPAQTPSATLPTEIEYSLEISV